MLIYLWIFFKYYKLNEKKVLHSPKPYNQPINTLDLNLLLVFKEYALCNLILLGDLLCQQIIILVPKV